MTPTKLLIGQVIVVLAIVLCGIWAGTQFAASRLAYQPELGLPWLELFGFKVFQPWQLFTWWYHFGAYAPHVFDRAGEIAATGGLLGCGSAVAGSVWRARQAQNVITYGSARWAASRDMVRAGLFAEAGPFLGKSGGRYIRHDGPEHIMAFAPTRSGKGVGLVVPTLLGWTGSAVSIVSASLITGLRSDLPGLVTAQVTENVFDSPTGQILLIPQGARLVGSYDSVNPRAGRKHQGFHQQGKLDLTTLGACFWRANGRLARLGSSPFRHA